MSTEVVLSKNSHVHNTDAPPLPGAFLVFAVGTAIGAATLIVGVLIINRRLGASRRPIGTSFIAGILIGMSLLVVLPAASSRLFSEFGWSFQRILAMFIAGIVGLFALEHCILGHEHLPPAPPSLASKDAAGVMPVDTTQLQPVASVQAMEACEPCEPCEGPPIMSFAKRPEYRRGERKRAAVTDGLPAVPPAVGHGAPPCECCEVSRLELGEPVAADVLINCDGSPLLRRLPACTSWLWLVRVVAEVLRVVAWLVHSFLDGMVLGSCDSTAALLPLSLAVFVCSMQDVAAFCACIRKLPRRQAIVSLVLFALTFPGGAALSLWAWRRSGASREALEAARVILSALFVYMAVFEMSPPHTHSRLRNAYFLLAFLGGMFVAGMTDALEELASSSE